MRSSFWLCAQVVLVGVVLASTRDHLLNAQPGNPVALTGLVTSAEGDGRRARQREESRPPRGGWNGHDHRRQRPAGPLPFSTIET